MQEANDVLPITVPEHAGGAEMKHYRITQDFVLGKDVYKNEYYLKKYYEANIHAKLELPQDGAVFLPMERFIMEEYGNTPSFRLPGVTETGICDSLFIDKETDIFISVHLNYFPAFLHHHTYFEIVYVLDGTCINYTEGQPLTMKRSDLLILPPGTEHAVSSFADGNRIINILIRASLFEHMFFKQIPESDMVYTFFNRVLNGNVKNSFLFYHTHDDVVIKSCILNLFHDQIHFHYYLDSLKVSYVSLIFSRLLNMHEGHYEMFDAAMESEHNISMLIRYMQNNYATITLKKMSGFFGYSERHLTRILCTYTGEGFQKNLQHIRVQKAKEYLRYSRYSIEKIALLVGYSSTYNFREVFKKECGMTPSEFQRQCTETMKSRREQVVNDSSFSTLNL